jgi:hypothetical protein
VVLQAPEEVVTSAQTAVVAETLPEAPVIVMSYAPVVVVPVVDAVSVEVCAVVSLIVTEVGERLHVAGLTALEGAVVTEHESATVPVNELDGVTVMVEVLPMVAPGATIMLPLLVSVKLVLLPPGACQKSPQPAKNTARADAAANSDSRVNLLTIIAAPSLLLCWPVAFFVSVSRISLQCAFYSISKLNVRRLPAS